MNNCIGADIGGSHITTAIVRRNDGKVSCHSLSRHPVDAGDSAENILAQWAAAINHTVEGKISLDYRIAIAMPGPFDYQNGICLMKNVNKYDSLYGINIRDALAERLRIESNRIMFVNDAEAFLTGEMKAGAGVGFQNGMGLTLGTGLGTSVFSDGKAKDTGMGFTFSYKEGVIEDYVSTRWFIGRYKELTGKTISGVKDLIENPDNSEIQPFIFKEFATHLNDFIGEFILLFHPEVIVIGGNIARSFGLFETHINDFLRSHAPGIKLIHATLGEEAAIIGAAEA